MSDLSRRDFLQMAGLGAVALPAVPAVNSDALASLSSVGAGVPEGDSFPWHPDRQSSETMIGAYGPWAASIAPDPPLLSFRRDEWRDVDTWRATGRERLWDRLAPPETGGVPDVTVRRRYVFDDLLVEELSWQLPYGPPTEAILLKPRDARGRLPGILALHDHSGHLFFGKEKITRTSGDIHPTMAALQAEAYDGRAWANEMARLGHVVLVPDAFAFGSRRVRLEDVPARIRRGLPIVNRPPGPWGPAVEPNDHSIEGIAAYDRWSQGHDSVMAKSLLAAGTTWPAVLLSEDQRALDVLCARSDVDPDRIGCGGLSVGGLRTVYLGGADPRIRCAVCVGMMTTWNDFLLHGSHPHTWMIYIPLLPRELDFPEILALRAPLPTMVLNNREDPLFTLSEMETADRMLSEIFVKAGAGERFHSSYYPGPHKFDQEMQEDAFSWFERWL